MAGEGATMPPHDKAAVRAELEAARSAYHALLDAIPDDKWRSKSGNGAWSIAQLMHHLAWSQSFVPGNVKNTKKGKGFNPPQFLLDPLNVLLTRLGARGATKASVGLRYDETIAKTIEALEGVQDEDWSKTARNFGVVRDMGDVFAEARTHLDEHEADIRQGLAGS